MIKDEEGQGSGRKIHRAADSLTAEGSSMMDRDRTVAGQFHRME